MCLLAINTSKSDKKAIHLHTQRSKHVAFEVSQLSFICATTIRLHAMIETIGVAEPLVKTTEQLVIKTTFTSIIVAPPLGWSQSYTLLAT